MDRKKLLFGMIITLCVTMLIFNFKINSLSNEFSKDCVTYYNISDPCPCEKKISAINNIPFSINGLNLTGG